MSSYNPYDPPSEASMPVPDRSAKEPQSLTSEIANANGDMTPEELKNKCKQILARRDCPATPWYYVVRNWRRQVLFCAGYFGIAAVFWVFDYQLLSVACLGFYIGRTVRDVRWWRALAKEWPSTSELLDWPRIERIAATDGENKSLFD